MACATNQQYVCRRLIPGFTRILVQEAPLFAGPLVGEPMSQTSTDGRAAVSDGDQCRLSRRRQGALGAGVLPGNSYIIRPGTHPMRGTDPTRFWVLIATACHTGSRECIAAERRTRERPLSSGARKPAKQRGATSPARAMVAASVSVFAPLRTSRLGRATLLIPKRGHRTYTPRLPCRHQRSEHRRHSHYGQHNRVDNRFARRCAVQQ